MLKTKWWQSAVFYQIYPRSFADGNGDGIGDFTGMIEKLDYLQDLGVDAIWLSPHFPSPYIDCGYDVSDYRGVAPEYGTMDQFKEFLAGLHARGMRLVLDLVLNHTSDQHPWFIESRQSKDNPKRDWYVWKPARDGKAPNNWFSTFGGSAWNYDEKTGEYYYHFFFKEQPDLNWQNPKVQEAMFNEARFLLDLGVDGFRLDAVGTLFEDKDYQDNTSKMSQEELFQLSQLAKTQEQHTLVMKHWMEMFYLQVDQPEVHKVTRDLKKVVNEYEDRVLIGETDDITFYGDKNNELDLIFNFPLMRKSPLTAAHVILNQRERLTALPDWAWPCNTLGNHDSSRVYTNFGDGVNNDLQARLYLMLLLTLKGTPFLYNGEEIGMSDYLFTDVKRFRDPLNTLYYQLAKGVMKMPEGGAARVGAIRGRDKCRTPMQWANNVNAGFSPVWQELWLPVNPNFHDGVNVCDQEIAKDSLLNYYKRLLSFRRKTEPLIIGDYIEKEISNPYVMAFFRKTEQDSLLVMLNLSGQPQQLNVLELGCSNLGILFSSQSVPAEELSKDLLLSAYVGVIARMV
jgi:alpha-glucosidase